MAFILSAGATLRLLAARTDDPFVQWIEYDQVRPFIGVATMAIVRHAILTTDTVQAEYRRVFERRYQALARDLDANQRKQVIPAIFDLKSAEILSDILSISSDGGMLSDIDLMPAAVAMQHNFELVVTEHTDAWGAFASAISPVLGRLFLKPFPDEVA
ncbi:MAG: type II toxin-antitoxin system VapC family toxin [Alphaproteobacteria bacterium]|nr:type II toxin-antitoxin system VapC family toxin [Alphaproteobacteria bacterium]